MATSVKGRSGVVVHRRSLPCPAVRCLQDNEDEVNEWLKDCGDIEHIYSAHPHGGWQHLRHRSYKDSSAHDLWVGSWLVFVPDEGHVKIVPEGEFDRIYR